MFYKIGSSFTGAFDIRSCCGSLDFFRLGAQNSIIVTTNPIFWPLIFYQKTFSVALHKILCVRPWKSLYTTKLFLCTNISLTFPFSAIRQAIAKSLVAYYQKCKYAT